MAKKKNKSKKSVISCECKISSPKQTHTIKEETNDGSSILFWDDFEPDVLTKWPKPNLKVPDILLHKPFEFNCHVHKLLSKGVRFYQPILGRNTTRISCPTYEDHKAIVQYFDKKHLPYHTFGNPTKRKLKVVVRGLQNVGEEELKTELKTSIPVIRVHKMKRHRIEKDKNFLFLVVVPNNDKGRNMLLVRQIFGYDVKMEPMNDKTKQCHRCQMWGHSQRFCHGQIKCVKCAGEHLSKQCEKDPDEPVKCANCGCAGHVASFRGCSHCPESEEYKSAHPLHTNAPHVQQKLPKLVTFETCERLYKNVRYH